MKVLLITEFFPQTKAQFSGGVEARTYFLKQYLGTHESVEVISNTSKSNVAATTSSLLPRLWFQIRCVFSGIQKDFDVVEGSNLTTYIPAFIVGLVKGKPKVAWIPDIYGQTWFRDFSLLPALFGFLQEKVVLVLPWSQVIAMSKSTQKKLIKAGVAKSRITVVYGGVDIKKIEKIQVQKYRQPTLVTLARLVRYKKIDTLIKAVAELKNRGESVTLRVLGDGPQLQDLQTLAKELRVENQVIFMGNVEHDKAMRILKKSHIFSLASIVEGFGLVTVEAMAAGIPFVNSDIPPTREITKGGKGGYLFEPDNHMQLADKVQRILLDKQKYQTKKEEALDIIKQYDWRQVNQQTVHVYKKALIT